MSGVKNEANRQVVLVVPTQHFLHEGHSNCSGSGTPSAHVKLQPSPPLSPCVLGQVPRLPLAGASSGCSVEHSVGA